MHELLAFIQENFIWIIIFVMIIGGIGTEWIEAWRKKR
jgi:hypothetical protein